MRKMPQRGIDGYIDQRVYSFDDPLKLLNLRM